MDSELQKIEKKLLPSCPFARFFRKYHWWIFLFSVKLQQILLIKLLTPMPTWVPSFHLIINPRLLQQVDFNEISGRERIMHSNIAMKHFVYLCYVM